MKLKNVVLTQLDGTPAPANERVTGTDEVLTLGRVLINAALSPDTANGMKPVNSGDSVARYELAMRLYNTAIDQTFDVKNDLLMRLQNDILRLYAPLISGQIIRLFEGARAGQSGEPGQ
jgi:hypothetical protein